MTPRFRTFLAWLLLLAIPLQSMAAVSMLYCGPAAKAAMQVRQSTAQHHHAQDGASGHQHPQQAHHAAGDHASHGHAAPDTGSKAVGGSLPDAGHKCGVCAACCHAVAIAGTPHAVAISPAPQTVWAEPFVLVHSRPSPVPDKPPRG